MQGVPDFHGLAIEEVEHALERAADATLQPGESTAAAAALEASRFAVATSRPDAGDACHTASVQARLPSASESSTVTESSSEPRSNHPASRMATDAASAHDSHQSSANASPMEATWMTLLRQRVKRCKKGCGLDDANGRQPHKFFCETKEQGDIHLPWSLSGLLCLQHPLGLHPARLKASSGVL